MAKKVIKKKHWRTTSAAWGVLVAAVLLSAAALLDLDPDTTPNFGVILKAMAPLGLGIPAWLMGKNSADQEDV